MLHTAAKAVEDLALVRQDQAAEARHQFPDLWERLDALFAVIGARSDVAG